MSDDRARYGWESDFPEFRSTEAGEIRKRLHSFVRDASPEQMRAWGDSIAPLQQEVDEVLVRDALAQQYSAILEYELPLESRRPDVILLVGNGILVVELKGKLTPSRADIDQAAAYARDLRCYHRECWNRPVVPVLVPTRARGYIGLESGVHVAGPDDLDRLVAELTGPDATSVIDRDRFLDHSAYCPLPTLVEAARELFHSGELRTIHRARAATDPAVEAITTIVHQAAATKSRHLVLVTGVPGAGKTLVGLRTVHARYLDDLTVDRGDGKPTTPAVFLSGNGPLVEVLQYELKGAGGGGKTFVRGVMDYVRRYSSKQRPVPPEHVLVFDEAQRAFDADMVRLKHEKRNGSSGHKSEPEHFVEFAGRIPEWCVVVGLIGGGQEIHVGEEAGLGQWRKAVENAAHARDWTVHAPLAVAETFEGSPVAFELRPDLNLDASLRHHQAADVHRFVARLLEAAPPADLEPIAQRLERDGFHLRLTRSLDTAKAYLRERYAENRDARFGLLASSRDRDLQAFGVANDYQSTKSVRYGPWYGDPEDHYDRRSCRHLERCVTEFGAQGLELDAVLLAWGTDFVLSSGRWSNALARSYKRGTKVKDPFRLRTNAYRVLLTRARDACVIFVPSLARLDETYEYLERAGFKTI
jgi:hypothetical protein